MKIEQATLEHLSELAILFDAYRVFYEQASDLEAVTNFLENRLSQNDSVIYIVINETGKGLGFTQLYPTFSSVSMQQFYILNDLYVIPEMRRKSIGESLLNQAKIFAKTNNLKGLALETAIDNPAQKLYEKLGWKKSSDFYHYFWNV
jgi:GNAT superfamily N-acetyltransferase